MTQAEQLEERRLQVNNAPDVRFNGRLLHEYTTQNREGTKARWSEIRLWETKAGAWVVESVGASTLRGEATLRDVLVMEPEEADLPHDARRVMDFLGWSAVAKAFAREMKWDVVRYVD